MNASQSWIPQQRHFEKAHVLRLAERLGVADYDALLALSVEKPDVYWRAAIDFLGIRWNRAPDDYVDLSRGREFPRWFPGGRLNWVDTVLAHAETAPDRIAVIDEAEDGSVRRLTFAELAVMIRRFAAGLRAEGIGRGDRVGLLCDNGIEATVSLLALAHMGAIVVPLFSGFGAEAVVSRLEPSAARAVIATTGFFRRGKYVDMQPVIQTARGQLPSVQKVIWKCAPGVAAPQGDLDWTAVAATADDNRPAEVMDPMDPFMVIYTSGTTGKPKGPVHTHGGFPLRIAHDSAVHFNVGPGDVFCWPADMGWIAGTLVLATALLRGATLVLYSGAPDFPDWSRMGKLIADHRITHYGSAPTLIRGLAANEALALRHDRSGLQLLITAGEVIDAEHFLWFQNVFAANGSPLINYTGGTEVSGALLSSVQVKPIAPGGFNTASPGIDVTVTDATGRPVMGEVGELVIRGPFVGMTASFWQDDARYLDSYWTTIPGLWVHGDLAVKTPDGGFVMMGRSDDTLKVAGKRLGPAEVEEVVLEMSEISEAAAVGISDAVKGQKLIVFVLPMPGFAGDRDDLAKRAADAVGDRLGKPFKPAKVHVVTQLPKTRSGKIMRRLIRQAYGGEKLGDLSSLDNPAALDEIAALGTH
ncbi:AMP-binding protein [Ruixingdingia sedimenti]|uniref:acetate--CoA ligase n=1 Tax=Ruixingdingia sedimenti TaxID=3073604 RepID=A0ABU1F8U3_9RHOB|nr:AMP-binding protein [Xinfangfangia sp. LG-4]MDR5653291.1 AMP-binding protein [Xinfangfangia sp. LG-4]